LLLIPLNGEKSSLGMYTHKIVWCRRFILFYIKISMNSLVTNFLLAKLSVCFPQKRFSSYFIFFCSSHLFYIFPRYRFCRSNISDDGEKNSKRKKYKEFMMEKWAKSLLPSKYFFKSRISLSYTQKEPQFFNRLTGNLHVMRCYHYYCGGALAIS
jgi:hypothetical protein